MESCKGVEISKKSVILHFHSSGTPAVQWQTIVLSGLWKERNDNLDNYLMTTNDKDILPLILEGIYDRKGRKVTTINMSDIDTAAARRFVICEGTSTQHVAAVADSIREYLLKEAGVKPYNYEGYGNSQWIVIDYGDTLVHVFQREIRELYNLEELWSDGVITDYPDRD